MIAKGEVFDGCMMILSGILGVRPYTAIMEKWERCGYLPAVKYPSQYLCPSSKSSVDVNDCNETVWNTWRYLSCVLCVCAFGFGMCLHPHLGVQGHGSSWGLFLYSVLVHASVWGAWSSMHAVLSVCSCSGAWWCHLQWAHSLWSVVMIGSVSYLIFSDKMSSRVLIVYLSGVCCVFSPFSFYVNRVK